MDCGWWEAWWCWWPCVLWLDGGRAGPVPSRVYVLYVLWATWGLWNLTVGLLMWWAGGMEARRSKKAREP